MRSIFKILTMLWASQSAAFATSPPKINRDDVLKVMLDSFHFLSQEDLVETVVLKHFAPHGARLATMALLTNDKPYLIKNEVVATLRVFEPLDYVIWWLIPKSGPIKEFHMSMDPSARIVPYELFTKAAKLPASTKQMQSHALSDIVHEHSIKTKRDQVLTVQVSQIVWSGDFVGKVSEFSVIHP